MFKHFLKQYIIFVSIILVKLLFINYNQLLCAGLNRDIWHTVTVRIDVHGARLIAKVDNINAEKIIQGLHKSSNYGISTDLTSVVLIGGIKI